MTTSTETIEWFRHTAPYINAHRGKTMVVGLTAAAIHHENFGNLIHDLALMHSMGIKLVIVHDVGSKTSPNQHQPLDQAGLDDHLAESSSAHLAIEQKLSTGLPNSPLHRTHLRVSSGNFVTARPIGVIEGVDFLSSGVVRNVDAIAIHHSLNGGSICLISPVAHSPAGETFALDSLDLMRAVAIAISADKLIVMSEHEGLQYDGDLIRQTTVEELRSGPTSDALGPLIRLAVDACDAGIARVHLIGFDQNGAILKELFTHDGAGTLVSPDSYEQTRPANIEDIPGLIELIRPLEKSGALVPRSLERIERDIDDYICVLRDGRVIACAAVHRDEENGLAELACLATDPAYRDQGHGERLIKQAKDRAKAAGISRLFVRTTQTAHWFREQGFSEISLEKLPSSLHQDIDESRQSKLFMLDDL